MTISLFCPYVVLAGGNVIMGGRVDGKWREEAGGCFSIAFGA